jgi:hypothetical protein
MKGLRKKTLSDDISVCLLIHLSTYLHIKVAEMHGELLEFNEMLQKNVQTKDQLINRLRSELVLLRGPLPEDQVIDR